MYMTKNQPKLYPNLVRFVKTFPLRVPTHRARVWEAFLGISGLTDVQARQALKWGNIPILRVIKLPRTKAGKFNRGTPNIIYLAKHMVERFEIDWQKPAARLLVESTILHELVHWANERLGGKHRHGRYGSVEFEFGDWFEELGYGQQTAWWW